MKANKKALLKPWWNQIKSETIYLNWPRRQIKRLSKEVDLRKLDIEVAEKVFGHKVEIIEVTEYHEFGGQTDYPELGFKIQYTETHEGVTAGWEEKVQLPNYSTDIKDAWEVAEKMFTDSWKLNITASELMGDGIGGVDAKFSCKCEARGRFEADDDTISKAICLAALKAVEHANK